MDLLIQGLLNQALLVSLPRHRVILIVPLLESVISQRLLLAYQRLQMVSAVF